MYWSVIGDRSHIEESAMDGSLRRVLLDKRLRRPTGICIAMHDQSTLYFLSTVSVYEEHFSKRL